MQKILIIDSESPVMITQFDGIGGVDGNASNGMLDVKEYAKYKTVLNAMQDGWRLMGQPQADPRFDQEIWTWYLEK